MILLLHIILLTCLMFCLFVIKLPDFTWKWTLFVCIQRIQPPLINRKRVHPLDNSSRTFTIGVPHTTFFTLQWWRIYPSPGPAGNAGGATQ